MSLMEAEVDGLSLHANGNGDWLRRVRPYIYYERDPKLHSCEYGKRGGDANKVAKRCITLLTPQFAATFAHSSHSDLRLFQKIIINKEKNPHYAREGEVVMVNII